jgi:DNA-binding CsgD family transcriptional regulator
VWTSAGVRVFGPPLVNPVWIAVNMLLRARGLRLGANATTAQLNLAETFFDVQAAIDAAAICNEQVDPLVAPLVPATTSVWVPDDDPENPDGGHWEDQPKDYWKSVFQTLDQTRGRSDPKLSDKDKVILRCIFQGLTNKEIGVRLDISEGAVKASLRQLFHRLGVGTRAQLVKVALEEYRDQL